MLAHFAYPQRQAAKRTWSFRLLAGGGRLGLRLLLKDLLLTTHKDQLRQTSNHVTLYRNYYTHVASIEEQKERFLVARCKLQVIAAS